MAKETKSKNTKKRVKKDDTVFVRYTARLKNGEIVGSTIPKAPLEIDLKNDVVHNSIKLRLVGMEEGESQIITITSKKAFGPSHKDLIFEIDSNQFDSTPKIGEFYKVKNTDGNIQRARVKKINDSKIILDANHQLAGKDIICEIEVIKIAS